MAINERKKIEKNHHISIFGVPYVAKNIERRLNISFHIAVITRFG
jgi:hypothetical protein